MFGNNQDLSADKGYGQTRRSTYSDRFVARFARWLIPCILHGLAENERRKSLMYVTGLVQAIFQ